MNITSKTFAKAIAFAAEAHKEQFRKGDGRPYIMHPIEVMTTIMSIKKSSNPYLIGCAAILHDTVEDCEDVTIEIIAEEFGYHIAALVEELTLDKREYERMGKTAYLIQEMQRMSSYALAIKLVDRLRNISEMKNMDAEFILNYKKETKAIIVSLQSVDGRRLTKTHKKLVELIHRKLLSLN